MFAPTPGSIPFPDLLVLALFEVVFSISTTALDHNSVLRPFSALAADGEAMSGLAERSPGLPIYVLSGHDQLEPPVATVGRLTKPFDSRLLVDAIEQLYAARPQA